MDVSRNRISDLYHQTMERPPHERATFLANACSGDDQLRREIESLLAFEPEAESFLESARVATAEPDPRAAHPMLNRQLGPYLIVAPLGVGGMGEVYRARDIKLGRDVALKILRPHFMEDPERLARFGREARLLATLSHPNVGAIYGLQDADGVTALVLELVEGPTLAERLARGPLELSATLSIARQIAEALDAAHEKGIIHRDLKPANTVLQESAGSSGDVRVRVLDFGLAKMLVSGANRDDTQPPSGSPDGTADGRILGTPAYMSPEQARGLAVDKRTDIWAFGCVLFEMLAGRRAFDGDSVSDTLVSVLEREPDWALLPSDTPAAIVSLLERCLRKDPRRRLHDIADALIEIEDCADRDNRKPDARQRRRTPAARTLLWMLAAAVALIAWVALGNGSAGSSFTPDPVEVALNAPDGSRFAGMQIAISPNGRHVAFIATSRIGSSLWIRSMNTFEPREIPDTTGARSPFWSPDSSTIGYFQDRTVKTVPVSGGSPFTVFTGAMLPGSHFGGAGTWNRDGVIVFGPLEDGTLYRVNATGGTATRVTPPETTARGHRWPWFFGDGQHFLYLAGDITFELRVGSLASPSSTEIIGAAESHAAYAAGYLFFVRGGNLMAQAFDAADRKPLGEPFDLGRRTGIEPHNQQGMFAVSAAGALVYRASARTKSQLTWFDRAGSARGTVGDVGVYYNLDLSADGRRVAVARMTDVGGRNDFDIWTIEVATGIATRLTDDGPAWQFDPTWSPGGTRVAFNEKPIPTKGWFGLSALASDGRDEVNRLVVPANGPSITAPDWAPSDIIVYDDGSDLWTLAMSGDRKPTLFLDTKYNETHGALSPNGRWIAHQSNASGRLEVIVRPFPGKEPAHRISRDGGMYAAWRSDGRELFFLAPDGTMMAAGFDPGTGPVDAEPQKLFATPLPFGNNHPYAVAPDGQRFLFPRPFDQPPRLILDWHTLLPR